MDDLYYDKITASSQSDASSPTSTISADPPSPAGASLLAVFGLRLPKLEEAEHDESVDVPVIKDEPGPSNFPVHLAPLGPRTRGRPPKSITRLTVPPGPKAPRGRGKTGCFTCRLRKKKCDERKPNCENCEKNCIVCGGYAHIELWQNSKQKAVNKKNKKKWEASGSPPLPPFFTFIEDDNDKRMFGNFNSLFSVLSLNQGRENPFHDIIFPMTASCPPILHMLLALSGSHLMLKGNGDKRDSAFSKRIEWHYAETHSSFTIASDSDDKALAFAALNVLRTVIEGQHRGEWEISLNFVRRGLSPGSPVNTSFRRFLAEFFIFHKTASMFTVRGPTNPGYFDLIATCNSSPDTFVDTYGYIVKRIGQIRVIRDKVRIIRRERSAENIYLNLVAYENWGDQSCSRQAPWVSTTTVIDAGEIYEDLCDAKCNFELGNDHWLTWNLYKITAWLYMYRTIYVCAGGDPQLDEIMEGAFNLVQDIPADSGCQRILLMPVFIMGCCAFNHTYRKPIMDCLETIQNYSALGNIQHVVRILKRIWGLMDSEFPEDWDKTWDWEALMDGMGLNFLIT